MGWGVILALLAPAARLTAQDETPQIVVREGAKSKKDNGPRALGLLRMNSSGKATLVPIAILINGKFYDAGAYKADPVPMALDSGTVYEAESSGDSLGLFTVNGALHSKAPSSPNPWVATGSYLPNGSVAPRQGRKAEDVPLGLEKDEGPPRLTRGDEPKTAPSGSSTGNAPAGTGTSEKPGSAAPSSTETPAPAPAGGSSASPPAPPNAPASPAKPAEQTVPQPAKDQSPSKQPESQSSDDSYRPTLRRGKPTQPLPDDDETMPKAAAPKTAAGKVTAPASALSAVQLIPAISDAGGPDPRSYKFEWRKGEEGDRQQQMLAQAKEEFRTYLIRQAKASTTPKPPASKPGQLRHKPASKSAQPVLENVQFKAFDVWANNEPVMILSAEAYMPAAPGISAAGEPEHYSITLVARTDIYSNLHKLYLGITDKFHLDLTPRLELIDVVDADGDGRGELLFHETTDAGSGYVIYRATADSLWKMFDSLNPE
ncbi:MAG: hypothetical protein WCA16_20755 [Candidatus Sulfotelmatobacter sp.]